MANDDFDMGATLQRWRRAVRHPAQLTPAQRLLVFADWWSAIEAELGAAIDDQQRGEVLHRVVRDDVEHARRMATWARHEADDHEWQQRPENVAALQRWRAAKPVGGDEQALRQALAGLDPVVRARLSSRPKAPDKRDPATPRPANTLPPRWPPISPGIPWSVYLTALLVAFREAA